MIPDREPTQWDFDLADIYHQLETCDPEFFKQMDENAETPEKVLKICENIVSYFANKKEPIKDVSPADLTFLETRIKLYNKENLPNNPIPQDIENRANTVFKILHPESKLSESLLLDLPLDMRLKVYGELEDKELGRMARSTKALKTEAGTINEFRKRAVLELAKEMVVIKIAKRLVDTNLNSILAVTLTQLAVNDIKGAIRSLDLVSEYNKPIILKNIVKKLIEMENIEEADKLAKKYEYTVDQSSLELIIEALAEKGDIAEVEEKIKFIQQPDPFVKTVTAIALAVKDKNTEAIEEIDKIDYRWLGKTIVAVGKIAKIKHLQGLKEEAAIFFDKAEALAKRAQNSLSYIDNIIVIGYLQAKSGDIERANANFNNAKAKINLLSNEAEKANEDYLRSILEIKKKSILKVQLDCGLLEDAKETAVLLKSEYSRQSELSKIAILQAEKGDIIEAKKTIDLIQWKDKPFAAIAKKLATRGEIGESINILEQIVEPNDKIRVLIEIYKAQVVAKDAESAQTTFNNALELLKSVIEIIDSYEERSILTYELAKAKATVGKYNEAEVTVKDLVNEYKIRLLLYISKKQAQSKAFDESQKSFDRAIELMKQTPSIVSRLLGTEEHIKEFKEIYE